MSWLGYETVCPTCRRPNDSAAHASGEKPRDGDASICWVCGGIGIFDSTAQGRMRQPSEDELAEVMANPDVRRVTQAIGLAKSLGVGPTAAAQAAGLDNARES